MQGDEVLEIDKGGKKKGGSKIETRGAEGKDENGRMQKEKEAVKKWTDYFENNNKKLIKMWKTKRRQ